MRASTACKPGLRIDVVELRRHDQRSLRRGRRRVRSRRTVSICALVQIREGLRRNARQTDSSIAKATRKVVPALEHVIDWLSNRGRARQAGSLLSRPCFQGNQHKYELDLLRQRSLSASYISEFS